MFKLQMKFKNKKHKGTGTKIKCKQVTYKVVKKKM